MNTFDSEDIVILLLAVDMLDRFSSDELAQARKACNNAKQAAMINIRSRLIVVRGKLRTMQGGT